MTKLTYEQMNKLPKWAQEHIRVLEMRLCKIENEKRQWFETNPDDALVLLPYFHDGNHMESNSDQSLRNSQIVRFYPEGRKDWSQCLDFRLNKDRQCVEVHGGVGGISIEPSSGNSCRVYLKGRG